jgi:hypothetical protein
MTREFDEETGLELTFSHVLTMSWASRSTGQDEQLHIFREFSYKFRYVQTRTDEPLVILQTAQVLREPFRLIPNLRWILPIAAYEHDAYEPFHIRERSLDHDFIPGIPGGLGRCNAFLSITPLKLSLCGRVQDHPIHTHLP